MPRCDGEMPLAAALLCRRRDAGARDDVMPSAIGRLSASWCWRGRDAVIGVRVARRCLPSSS